MTRLDPLQFQGDVFFVTQGGNAVTDVGNFTWEVAYYEATPAARLSISSNILNRSNLNLFRFVYKEIDNVDILTGAQWCTAEDLGEWYSEHYDITDERMVDEGITYAIVDDMHPLDFGPGLVAYFPPDEGDMFAMLIPYDDTSISFYVFLTTDSGMYGRYWLLDEGESPEDSGYFFRGTILAMQKANDSSGAGNLGKSGESSSEISGEISQGVIAKTDSGSHKLLQIEQGAPMATQLFAPENVSTAFDRLSNVYELQVKPSRALD